MCSGLRLLLAFTVVLSVFCIVTSKIKHGHKKSHGPLRPGESKISHGKGKTRAGVVKHHHHFKKTIHAAHHLKHKHYSKHSHQPTLHLKAHKKGVTFAKAPAEPQACIDFLPCLQYRYYHCRSHEWIRNNCPKLCLYCEHQPFPEPFYGRFKTVAAAYPDWCLDHSGCVSYPTEACSYDEWMKLNCLRKCDICYKDKRVKAGILFVGPPFDQTNKQKKEEYQLNKILKFRPQPPTKDKNSKWNADQGNWSNGTAPANRSAATIKDKPIFQPIPPKRPTELPPRKPVSPTIPKDVPVGPVSPTIPKDVPVGPVSPTIPKDVPVGPVSPTIPKDVPVGPVSPTIPKDVPVGPVSPTIPNDSPVGPVSPIIPDLPKPNPPTKPPTKPNPPVVQQEILAIGKLGTGPNLQPATVNPLVSNQIPNANNPIGIPAYSYQDLINQELKAAKEAPSTKQFKADVLKEVQIKLKDGRFPQINTARVFAKHKVIKPKRKHVVGSLSAPKHHVTKHKVAKPRRKHVVTKHKVTKPRRKHVVESLSAPKHHVTKHKVTKPRRKHVVESLSAPKHHVAKHKVTKPRRKHVVESMNAPKHHVVKKPTGKHAKNIHKNTVHNKEKASGKHLLKKEKKAVVKKAKSRQTKVVKVNKQRDKVARKKEATGRRAVKKSKSKGKH